MIEVMKHLCFHSALLRNVCLLFITKCPVFLVNSEEKAKLLNQLRVVSYNFDAKILAVVLIVKTKKLDCKGHLVSVNIQ